MSGVSPTGSMQGAQGIAARILRASCEISFVFGLALLAASLLSIALEPGAPLHALRTAMLRFGIPLVAASMAVIALAAHRLARFTGVRELHRLRERLYFVAALVLTVLAPSALLGMRMLPMPPPGAVAVYAVEACAWLLAAWLLWGNASDARTLAGGEFDQSGEARAAERSMSSIR